MSKNSFKIAVADNFYKVGGHDLLYYYDTKDNRVGITTGKYKEAFDLAIIVNGSPFKPAADDRVMEVRSAKQISQTLSTISLVAQEMLDTPTRKTLVVKHHGVKSFRAYGLYSEHYVSTDLMSNMPASYLDDFNALLDAIGPGEAFLIEVHVGGEWQFNNEALSPLITPSEKLEQINENILTAATQHFLEKSE